MNIDERLELEEWIGRNVMKSTPRIEARAMAKNETTMAIWEGRGITKRDVSKFCRDHPEYHYVEAEIWPAYTRNAADAMDVLKKCLNRADVLISYEEGPFWVRTTGSRLIEAESDTLELAIAKFAKRLFSQPKA